MRAVDTVMLAAKLKDTYSNVQKKRLSGEKYINKIERKEGFIPALLDMSAISPNEDVKLAAAI